MSDTTNSESEGSVYSESTNSTVESQQQNKSLCIYYLRGNCLKGDSCNFLHSKEIKESTNLQKYKVHQPLCSVYFATGRCDDPDCTLVKPIICYHHLYGRCKYGKNCVKFHVNRSHL